jgi:hypothetical protein
MCIVVVKNHEYFVLFSSFFGGVGAGVDGSLIITVGVFRHRISRTLSPHEVVHNSVFAYPVTGHRELNFGRINVLCEVAQILKLLVQ